MDKLPGPGPQPESTVLPVFHSDQQTLQTPSDLPQEQPDGDNQTSPDVVLQDAEVDIGTADEDPGGTETVSMKGPPPVHTQWSSRLRCRRKKKPWTAGT